MDGGDGYDLDARVAERRAAEDGGEAVEQGGVGAIAGRQGADGAGGGDGVEVGEDVGAAEAVDRLLGVADQHERRVAVERVAQDGPLHRVGVLELVDQHDRVAGAEPAERGVAGHRVGEDGGEPQLQVVEVDQVLAPLALVDLALHSGGDARPQPRCAVGVPGRQQGGGAVLGGGRGELAELRRLEQRRVGVGPAPLAQVEVVGDLADQVGEVLDEHGVGVEVAGGAERQQHLLAEAVRGRDGGGVEGGERLLEPSFALEQLIGVDGGQVDEDLVVGVGRFEDAVAGGDQAFADPLAQLAGRLPAEADDEQLVHRRHALGDVAGDQGGDRVRLAGARAGLEHGRAGRQRPEQVEGVGHCRPASPRVAVHREDVTGPVHSRRGQRRQQGNLDARTRVNCTGIHTQLLYDQTLAEGAVKMGKSAPGSMTIILVMEPCRLPRSRKSQARPPTWTRVYAETRRLSHHHRNGRTRGRVDQRGGAEPIEETLDILSDPEELAALREGIAAADQGDTLPLEAVVAGRHKAAG